MTLHAGLAAGRWNTLSLAEQLAHVGSEVERAIRAWETRRFDRCEHAQARALELFDLTARDARWRAARRREILRVHFLRFAVLARRGGTPGEAVAHP